MIDIPSVIKELEQTVYKIERRLASTDSYQKQLEEEFRKILGTASYEGFLSVASEVDIHDYHKMEDMVFDANSRSRLLGQAKRAFRYAVEDLKRCEELSKRLDFI